MSERDIQNLKRKFIATAMISFIFVMIFMAGMIYIANLYLTNNEIHEVTNYIVQNRGVMQEQKTDPAEVDDSVIVLPAEGDSDSIQEQLESLFGINRNYRSPEFFYSTRYFSVIFDENGSVDNVLTSHIAAIDRTEAVSYAERVLEDGRKFGSYGDYYYQSSAQEDGSTIVVFLDCTAQVAFGRRIIFISLVLIGFGMILSYIVLRLLASRVVRPEIRNAEMQKAFITNASHELKTPLAVIRANTEMTEMMSGETEWTQSSLRQVDRMQGLIQNLVMITRAQEKSSATEKTEIDAAAPVKDTVETFVSLAASEGKILTMEPCESPVTLLADEADLRQLTSLLVDNAIKYCDAGGEVKALLTKKGRGGVVLAVSNPYKDGANVDYSRFFERFYRADQSHNQDHGGFGIGLSIAQALIEKYHGTIGASWENGVITFTCKFPKP